MLRLRHNWWLNYDRAMTCETLAYMDALGATIRPLHDPRKNATHSKTCNVYMYVCMLVRM